MNYGAEPADQVVRYSLEGMEYSLKITGNVAKHVAIFIAAALKDQKKTRGKTRLTRMLKEQRPMKFFTVPGDRLKEFAKEAKARGILYVVIKDKVNPDQTEVMVFADDAAKMNRVLDRMNLDFVKAESGSMVTEAVEKETAPEKAENQMEKETGENVRTETVVLPEGKIESMRKKCSRSGMRLSRKEILHRRRRGKKRIRPNLSRATEILLPIGKLAGKKRMKNHLCGKNSEISARNRKRNVRGRTDGKMPERAGRNVRI